MGSDQGAQAGIDAASLRITELKLDFKAMRSEAMRLEGEVMKAATEVEGLSEMNSLLRSQLSDLESGKHWKTIARDMRLVVDDEDWDEMDHGQIVRDLADRIDGTDKE